MSEGLDIRDRHTRVENGAVCWFCEMPWPCDTATVLAALADAERERDDAQAEVESGWHERLDLVNALAASEASQTALREALDEQAVRIDSDGHWCCRMCLSSYRNLNLLKHATTCLLATVAPPQADMPAGPLPTTESLTRSDSGVTGWTGESDEATP